MMIAKNSRGMPNIKHITIRNIRTKNRVATMLPVSVDVPESRMRPITSVWLINSNAIILSPIGKPPISGG